MVEYITYKKKKYPVRVSYFVTKRLKAENIDMAKLDKGEIEQIESVLFYAMQAGAHAEEIPFEFSREDMEFILDECYWDFLELLPKFFPKEVLDKVEKVEGNEKAPLKQQVKEMGKNQRAKK